MVTALNPEAFAAISHAHSVGGLIGEKNVSDRDSAFPPMVLNEWAASDLGAKRGDKITLEYSSLGKITADCRLSTADFMLDEIVPLNDPASEKSRSD